VPDLLPPEHRFSHEYAFFLHDILAHIVVMGGESGVFDTEFRLGSEEEAEEFRRLSSGQEVWDWIEQSRDRNLIYLIIYKQVTYALLSDFCHFVYEALSTARKGKLAVAYALLRKPLKDNLLFLEWLLAAPADFLETFYHREPEDYAVDKLPPEKKLEIMEAARARTSMPCVFDARFMYELRYDKRQPWGFEKLWQHATHLVTTFRAIRTSRHNFNFVFSGEEEWSWQQRQFYLLVPYVLFYAVEVVESLLATLAAEDPRGDLMSLRRSVGFLLWVDRLSGDTEMREAALEAAEAIRDELAITCPECQTPIPFGMTNMERLYRSAEACCAECGNVLLLADGPEPNGQASLADGDST